MLLYNKLNELETLYKEIIDLAEKEAEQVFEDDEWAATYFLGAFYCGHNIKEMRRMLDLLEKEKKDIEEFNNKKHERSS